MVDLKYIIQYYSLFQNAIYSLTQHPPSTPPPPSSRLNVRRICVHKFLSSNEIYRLFVYAISINRVLLPKVNRGSIVNEYLLFPLVNLRR